MSTTLTDARDTIGMAMLGVVNDIEPQPPVVFWDDTEPEEGSLPPANAAWLRIKILPTNGSQVSVSSGQQGTGKFRFTGLVMVQVFAPLQDGLKTSDSIAQAFLEGMQGRDFEGVWFENVRAVGRGREKQWTEQRVVADYFYDDNR